MQLGELVTAKMEAGGKAVFRRDGRGATMVTADLAGRYEAPIYGMLAVDDAIDNYDWAAHGLRKPEIILHGQPEDESSASLLWDGEWEITWVTFRDMGGAFMVALLGIYVLVVGQFRSFTIPLVILTPIPLTLVGIVIGVLPGAGADIAAWVSCSMAKRFSKEPEKFGTGHPEGLIEAGASNNASLASGWVPSLLFAIPGDTITAIAIGVLYMKGLNPGPGVEHVRAVHHLHPRQPADDPARHRDDPAGVEHPARAARGDHAGDRAAVRRRQLRHRPPSIAVYRRRRRGPLSSWSARCP